MSSIINQDGLPSRVNIKLKSNSDDDQEKKELSFKLLMLGEYEGQKQLEPFNNRVKHQINSRNYQQVLKELAPTIQCECDNYIDQSKDKLTINLKFESMHDFTPDGLCQKIPKLKRMIAMRHILKDLKTMMLDNHGIANDIAKLIDIKPVPKS